MKRMTLSSKILLNAGLVLFFSSVVGFALLYRAQSQLVLHEMDANLQTQALALSTVVTAQPQGVLDFEVSPNFVAQYESANAHGFFRFLPSGSEKPLRESAHAPAVSCSGVEEGKTLFSERRIGDRSYRIVQHSFQPRPEDDAKSRAAIPPWICLVVGIDEEPYRDLVTRTILSTAPVSAALLCLALGLLLILMRKLTLDLSRLRIALERGEFSATHAFPVLPSAATPEVDAIIAKLRILHSQAAQVYQEMWLFMGRAAHQLKTPVTGLRATLDVLLRKERTREELVAGLSDVQTGMKQLVSLTQKLLSSSRITYQFESGSSRLSPMRLDEFLSDQPRLFRSQAEQREIILKIGAMGPALIKGNEFLLSELFGNLIENSVLYTRQGGTVVIELEQRGMLAVVSVIDQGAGFSEEMKAQLFTPFVRGDERVNPGSGLGLSIAKRAAQALGGELTLASSGPEGSVLQVVLPLA
jgi:signal transduction histidine kinase